MHKLSLVVVQVFALSTCVENIYVHAEDSGCCTKLFCCGGSEGADPSVKDKITTGGEEGSNAKDTSKTGVEEGSKPNHGQTNTPIAGSLDQSSVLPEPAVLTEPAVPAEEPPANGGEEENTNANNGDQKMSTWQKGKKWMGKNKKKTGLAGVTFVSCVSVVVYGAVHQMAPWVVVEHLFTWVHTGFTSLWGKIHL